MDMEHLQRAVPVLASLDIAKTVAFYQKSMGFDKLGWQDEQYAVLGRDHVEIHFWKCNDRIHPENTSCYIYVQDVDGLYAELSIKKVIHPNGPLEDKPWGTREFAVLDEDGNMIKFGQNRLHAT